MSHSIWQESEINYPKFYGEYYVKCVDYPENTLDYEKQKALQSTIRLNIMSANLDIFLVFFLLTGISSFKSVFPENFVVAFVEFSFRIFAFGNDKLLPYR